MNDEPSNISFPQAVLLYLWVIWASFLAAFTIFSACIFPFLVAIAVPAVLVYYLIKLVH